jgi:two-component system, NtrC family, sensor histidine kinase PilS
LGPRLTALVLFRTVATTLILVLAGVQMGFRKPIESLSAADLGWFGVVAVDYLLTLVSALALRRGPARRWLAWTQVIGSVAFATSIVLLTDGRDSPFWFTYLLAIIGGAVALGMRGALGGASVAALSSVGVTVWGAVVNQSSARPLVEIITQVLAQFLVAGLSGYVAQQLIRTRGRLVESEEDLARTKELRDRIVTAIPSGLAVVEASLGRIRYVNPAGLAILGFENDTFPPVDEVFPGVLSVVVGRRWELISVTSRGERILGVSTSTLDAETVLIVFQDLTDVRRKEDEMARLDELAELGKVSATLAHEVRNPLASMRGSAQILLSDADEGSSQQRLSRIIVREADRLAYLVDHYLDLARPKAPQRTRVRLDTLVSETIEVLRADPAARGIAIEEQFAVREESLDAAQIKQVLINLLRNAFRATGPRGRVRVSVLAAPNTTLFEVWDSAGTVKPEELPHLFEPFYSREPDGTGLGLSTAQSIAHAHGARLSVESTPALGTTFRFSMQPALPTPAERGTHA